VRAETRPRPRAGAILMSTSRSQEAPNEQGRLPQLAHQVRLMSALVVPAGILLEALPLMAWLFLVAAADGEHTPTPLPSWWVVLVLLLAWAVGAFFRDDVEPGHQRDGINPRQKQFLVVGWVLTVAATYFISPAATGSTPLSMTGLIGLVLLI